MQPLRSSSITEPSSLLRAAPSLRPASVLSPSRLEPLVACPLASGNRFSRSIRKPGRASRRLHAGCRSGRLRHLPNCSQGKGHPPVLTSPNPLSTLHRRFACARLSRPCRLDFLPRLDCYAHHHELLAAAACSGLGSAPDCRTRRALLHLSYSCASPFGPATLVTHDPERKWPSTYVRQQLSPLAPRRCAYLHRCARV